MAQVKSNDIMLGLSGKLGRQLSIRHMRDGRNFVLTRPDFSNRVFSEEQLTHQSRFQLSLYPSGNSQASVFSKKYTSK